MAGRGFLYKKKLSDFHVGESIADTRRLPERGGDVIGCFKQEKSLQRHEWCRLGGRGNTAVVAPVSLLENRCKISSGIIDST